MVSDGPDVLEKNLAEISTPIKRANDDNDTNIMTTEHENKIREDTQSMFNKNQS